MLSNLSRSICGGGRQSIKESCSPPINTSPQSNAVTSEHGRAKTNNRGVISGTAAEPPPPCNLLQTRHTEKEKDNEKQGKLQGTQECEL